MLLIPDLHVTLMVSLTSIIGSLPSSFKFSFGNAAKSEIYEAVNEETLAEIALTFLARRMFWN